MGSNPTTTTKITLSQTNMQFNVSSPSGDRTIDLNLPKSGRIAVLLSGGLDSAVMLSLILMAKQKENLDLNIIAINVMRGRGTEEFSESMLNAINSHFNEKIVLHHIKVPPNVDDATAILHSTAPLTNAPALFKNIFCGSTTNPPIDHPGAPIRASVDKQHAFIKWRMPFLHCDKSHTVALMKHLGLDFIEELSHTCTETESLRCGECFQCTERAWAYSELGLIDKGKY